ncbi:hypothetical protein, partial [Amphritea atlantica]
MDKNWKKFFTSNMLSYIPPTSIAFKIVLMSSISFTLSFIFWDYISANHEQIRNIGLVSAALIGFPMLIWRTRIADKQTQISNRQTETSEASHIADVYTKAIEQLGAKDGEGKPHLELRLGGLYALERIAKSNEIYHPQIMEVLCAYVRMRSGQVAANKPNENKMESQPEAHDEQSYKIIQPETDIQAVITVIVRRNSDFDGLLQLDLSDAQLSRYDLNGANL